MARLLQLAAIVVLVLILFLGASAIWWVWSELVSLPGRVFSSIAITLATLALIYMLVKDNN